jgi:hypothetical protein
MRFIVIAAIVVGVCACKNKQEPEKEPGPAPTTANADKPAGDKPGDTPPEDSLKGHMGKHFEAVRDVQKAVVHNNLDAAKQSAKWIAEHKGHDAIEQWAGHIEVMRDAATNLQEAADIPAAAKLAADLAGQCASCHESLTAIATFEWTEKPKAVEGDIKSHMAMHQWGAERLWEGIVGPSDSHWLDGAEAFANDPLHAGEIKKGEQVPKEVEDLAKKIHELGAKAKTLSTTEERVQLYGEMLTTCAGCHAQTRK